MSGVAAESLLNVQHLVQAYALAAKLHAKQHRKSAEPDPDPYVNHLARVAALTAEETDEIAALCAAVLHDAVEDTPITLAELEEAVGVDVAGLVAWLTDDPAIENLPLPERKAAQAKKIAEAPRAAKLVKIADQVDNITDVRRNLMGFWSAARCRDYLGGARRVVDACRGVAPRLEDKFDAAAIALEAELEATAQDETQTEKT